MVLGFWKPVVLFPVAVFANLPADYLEALLAHELAHVRRRDFLGNLLQRLVEPLGECEVQIERRPDGPVTKQRHAGRGMNAHPAQGVAPWLVRRIILNIMEKD